MAIGVGLGAGAKESDVATAAPCVLEITNDCMSK